MAPPRDSYVLIPSRREPHTKSGSLNEKHLRTVWENARARTHRHTQTHTNIHTCTHARTHDIITNYTDSIYSTGSWIQQELSTLVSSRGKTVMLEFHLLVVAAVQQTTPAWHLKFFQHKESLPNTTAGQMLRQRSITRTTGYHNDG